MPRPNQPRTIGTEEVLAKRIAYEREAREWSNEGLASRMTQVGCSMAGSAVFKIENAGRRITVDELVAFAQVFGVKVTDLLVPADLAARQRVMAAYEAWADAFDKRVAEVRRLDADLAKAAARVKASLETHPEAADALREALAARFPAGSHWVDDMMEAFTDGQ